MMGGFGDGEKLLDDECLAGGIPAGGSPAGAPRSGPRDQRLTAFRQGQWADVTRGSGWLALQAGDVSQPEVLAEATDDEVLGIGGSGSVITTNAGALTGAVGPLDLFRYSAAGTRSFTASTNAISYFSINGGTNKLVNFNQGFGGESDYGDWGDGVSPADGKGNTPALVQDAFGTPGSAPDLGINELTALDVVGWNVIPEPSTVALVGIGTLAGFAMRRRRRRKS